MRRKATQAAVRKHDFSHPLAVALWTRDHYTREHSDRVVSIARAISLALKLSSYELELVRLGAQFHDIGKIGIPDRVLLKPASLEADEWECMKTHTLIGEQMILAIDGLHSATVARIVRHHHEHFDGSGYPDGLRGSSIPLASRIVSLADCYDAMIAARAYHKPRSHSQVMDVMHDEGNKHDPDLLPVLCQVVARQRSALDDATG